MTRVEQRESGRRSKAHGLALALALTLPILLLSTPGPALELRSPVSCTIGTECFVLQHVDRDPGPGAADHRCEPLTYDGHEGVDFALLTLEAMKAGVDVVAAADGLVEATRDGMPDVSRDDPSAAAPEGRECGNGVLLAHEGGWTTQYCHMKQGTVAVSEGAMVSAGQRLGSIGLSGDTEFPHLHLQVRRGDEVIDPFDGSPMDAACDPTASGGGLWAADSGVGYAPGGALSAGILDGIPEYSVVNATAPDAGALPTTAPAIVHWAHFFGLREGDVIESRLNGPGGAVVAEERHTMPKDRIRQFRAVGRRRPAGGWPAGVYSGVSRLERDGAVVDEIRTTVRVHLP